MTKKYAHELNKEVHSISGWYEMHKEEKIDHLGKEYLYIVGTGMVDSSCCGTMGCQYAVVPGSIVNWKSETNEDGTVFSEVEPVTDQKVKDELRKILMGKEPINQVQFW
jgi:hypothetical protein